MYRAFDRGADRSSSPVEAGGDRLVAVKLFRVDLEPERVHQLVGEFDRLVGAGLAHPAIAAPLEAGIAGVQAYLASEFVPADSLDIVVRDNGPAPVAHALKVATQLAGAIDYAAVVNVNHGALHPRDILVSAEDTRITGFGVAQALASVGVAVPLRRPYAAPEQIDNPKRFSRDADVFALAAIAYELLTGRRIAGAGADAADGLSTVADLDLDMARAVFARALAVDPKRRFETALQFVEALKQAVDRARLEALASEPKRAQSRRAEPRLPLDEPPVVTPVPVVDRTAPASEADGLDHADLDLAPDRHDPLQNIDSGGLTGSKPPVPDLPLAPPVESRLAVPSRPATTAKKDTGLPDAPMFGAVPASDDRPKSSTGSLLAILVVGLALGFGVGYGLRAVRAPSRPVTQAQPSQTSSSPAPSNPISANPTPAPQAAAPTPPPSVPPAGSEAAAERPIAPERQTAADDEAAGEVGRVLVRSTPAGARVYVDGRERGVTPLAVRNLSVGSHHLRIVRDGYVAEDRRLTISGRRLAQSLEIPLTRAIDREVPARTTGETFVGSLVVESRPTGASVYLDGKLTGSTPLQLSTVTAGSHVVRLEHDGYRRWSSAVRVVSGERNRVTASLEK